MQALRPASLLGCLLLAATLLLASETAAAAAELSPDKQRKFDEGGRLNQLASTLHRQGKYREAIAASQKSLALCREAVGEKHRYTAVSYNVLGYYLGEAGDLPGAKVATEKALAIRRATLGEHPDTATSLNNLGHLCMEMGDFASAEAHLRAAMAMRTKVLGPRHHSTAEAMSNLSAALGERGDFAEARRLGAAALAIRRETLEPNDPSLAASLNDFGILLSNLGDDAAALKLHEEALAIRSKYYGKRHPITALALDQVGSGYARLGDYAAAMPFLQQALEVRVERLGPAHADVGQSLKNIAYVLLEAKQYREALPILEKSLAIYQKSLGPKHPETALALNNLGFAQRHLNDFAGAKEAYEQSLAIVIEVYGEEHSSTARALNNLATLLDALGEKAAAHRNRQRAAEISQTAVGLAHPDTAVYLRNLASSHAALGEWREALEKYDASRRATRKHITQTLPGLVERQQLRFLKSLDADALLAALWHAHDRQSDVGTPDKSAEWLVNGKAVIHETLAQQTLLRRDSAIPGLAQAAEELRKVRQDLAKLSNQTVPASSTAAHRAKIEALERREVMASKALLQARGKSQDAESWVALANVRNHLPAGAVLVDIARLDSVVETRGERRRVAGRYVAWVTPREGSVAMVDLGLIADVDAAVRNFQAAMQAAMGADGKTPLVAELGEVEAAAKLQESLRPLAKLVLDPLLPHLAKSKQVVLSPDAALWIVPWAALPLADGRFAVEEFQFRYVVSSRELVPTAPTGAKPGRPVIFADPNYDLSAADAAAALASVVRGSSLQPLATRSTPRAAGGLPRVLRLPGTAIEAKAITPGLEQYAQASPLIYTDRGALEGVFKQVKSPSALVLSTHGYFLAAQQVASSADDIPGRSSGAVRTTANKPVENPLLRCGLLLAGCNTLKNQPNSTIDDGVLTGLEILDSDLRGTDLVVLSACETGLGEVRDGEGVAGLRQAFQLAGAQSVVSTLWQIPDKESATLMSSFFAKLAAGESKAEALRAAQLELIKSRRDRHGAAHPLYWAAFTVTGK